MESVQVKKTNKQKILLMFSRQSSDVDYDLYNFVNLPADINLKTVFHDFP